MDEAALRARRVRSQRGFLEALGCASDGARCVTVGGAVWAAIVPARPDRSIVNSVVYEETEALAAALPELASTYDDAGIMAWTVWVPEADRRAIAALDAAGHRLDGRPHEMAAALDELDLEPRRELDLDPEPAWLDIAELNEAAYFASAGGRYLGPALGRFGARAHVARCDGRAGACLAVLDVEGDAYVAFVATRPEARRQGLAGELLRHALREARARGMETTTLEATALGAPVYAGIGYRDLGVVEMWERRLRDESA